MSQCCHVIDSSCPVRSGFKVSTLSFHAIFCLQEKKGSEKNPKFSHDFKTLADVLIQETLRHDVGTKFPKIASNIRVSALSPFTRYMQKN